MNNLIKFVSGLLDSGETDIAGCLDFLCDGDALAKSGFTDKDEIESAFDFLAELNAKAERNILPDDHFLALID